MTHTTATEQHDREEEKRLRDEIEKKTGKSPEELFEEREKRLQDAIQLREPDRLPVVLGGGYFAAKYAGVPAASAYYDVPTWKAANRKMIVELEPDFYRGVASGIFSGPALEALDTKQIRWPGGALPPTSCHQFVEGEYMKEDEYDLFLSDPSDFMLRFYFPRTFGVLSPLSKLPPLRNMSHTTLLTVAPLFATPEFLQAAQALAKAGQEQERWRSAMSTFDAEMGRLGFPGFFNSVGVMAAPFDTISDYFRGMRGAMMDMFRRPEKLLAACDKILEWRKAELSPVAPEKKGRARVFMPLHRGAEGFMSLKQFEKFYWPGLKKAMLANIELGMIPLPFLEGICDSRLEYFLEMPKGSVVCHFEHTDMARAKAVLGDHLCIMGNVPSSLLQVGSPSEVEEYCKNLIKTCGKGGGFILAPGSSIDEAKPENLKAMVDAARKYGAS